MIRCYGSLSVFLLSCWPNSNHHQEKEEEEKEGEGREEMEGVLSNK